MLQTVVTHNQGAHWNPPVDTFSDIKAIPPMNITPMTTEGYIGMNASFTWGRNQVKRIFLSLLTQSIETKLYKYNWEGHCCLPPSSPHLYPFLSSPLSSLSPIPSPLLPSTSLSPIHHLSPPPPLSPLRHLFPPLPSFPHLHFSVNTVLFK